MRVSFDNPISLYKAVFLQVIQLPTICFGVNQIESTLGRVLSTIAYSELSFAFSEEHC